MTNLHKHNIYPQLIILKLIDLLLLYIYEILKNTNKAFNVYKDGKINNLLNEVSILRINIRK